MAGGQVCLTFSCGVKLSLEAIKSSLSGGVMLAQESGET